MNIGMGFLWVRCQDTVQSMAKRRKVILNSIGFCLYDNLPAIIGPESRIEGQSNFRRVSRRAFKTVLKMLGFACVEQILKHINSE